MTRSLKYLAAAVAAALTGGTALAADYQSWDGWSATSATTAVGSAALIVPAALPTTGSATYKGAVLGAENRAGNRGIITGTANLTADFGAHTLNGSFANLKRPFGGANLAGSTTPVNAAVNASWGTTNSIAGNVTAATSKGAMSGVVNGAFFGIRSPVANVAGTWTLSGAGTTAAGAFAAKQP